MTKSGISKHYGSSWRLSSLFRCPTPFAAEMTGADRERQSALLRIGTHTTTSPPSNAAHWPNRFPFFHAAPTYARCIAVAAIVGLLTASESATQTPPSLTRLTNRIFSAWDSTTRPGCAVGIAQDNQPRFTHAYGLAELEFDVPNRSETIFEAGSVSKQFTAAAVVLLALDGKLGLDDDVRKFMPELRVYERPITIRHLLNHTSGLRDWGDIASMAGWPRTTACTITITC